MASCGKNCMFSLESIPPCMCVCVCVTNGKTDGYAAYSVAECDRNECFDIVRTTYIYLMRLRRDLKFVTCECSSSPDWQTKANVRDKGFWLLGQWITSAGQYHPRLTIEWRVFGGLIIIFIVLRDWLKMKKIFWYLPQPTPHEVRRLCHWSYLYVCMSVNRIAKVISRFYWH